MSRNLKIHERKDTVKWVLVSLALLLVGVILCGMITNWYKEFNPFCWFGHDYGEDNKCVRCGKDKPADEPEQAESNVVIETVIARGMQLNAAPAATAADPDTYTLTATITPASADDKRVEWTVAWKDATSTWATGKTVTEYVTVTPTSANALTATVACVKDFGEQVIVTVKSLDNAEASATCTVDYVQRITGFTFNMPAVTSAENTFTYNIETSNYTLKSNISFNIGNELSLTEAFKQEFSTYFGSYTDRDYLLYASASLGKRGDNAIFIEDGNWGVSSELLEDYYFPNNLVGCFYGFDGQTLDEVLGDMGLLTRAFRETANKITTAHATFTVTYSATYNGTVYSSGSKTIEVKFDGEALHILVTSLSLSNSSLVF